MSDSEKVRAVIISKHAIGMRVTKRENGKNALCYEVGNDTFIRTAEDQLKLTGDDCTIMLDIPKFNVFITGDLSFHADVLGKANSSGYWCHLCQLSWAQWYECANEEATKWMIHEFKKALHTKIKRKTDSIMGVKEEMHYKEISPQLIVCPPLHMEIGLVNKVWEELCLWVDQECEILSEGEIEAKQMAALANQIYAELMREQERLKGDVVIGLKADKVLLKHLLEAPRIDPRSRPAKPQDYKQERTEHAFTGVNNKLAWRAARLQSSCTGVHSRTRHRSAMAITVY
jgi:hypothetical protein